MFVEEKRQGEIAPAKVLKFSQAIRLGKPMVGVEDKSWFHLCALGCAFAGVHGRPMTLDENDAYVNKYPDAFSVAKAIARDLGFSESDGLSVNSMHYYGMPALEIAARLEKEGK